ncbi:MAG: hypothetical protein Kow0075_14260 [Salibacteraceae bacterium]
MLPELERLTNSEYLRGYLALVEHSDVLTEFSDCTKAVNAYLANLHEDKLNHRYAPGKWTVGQVLHHVIECEIIFGYRALRVAREPDEQILPGFDENMYESDADLSRLHLRSLVEYFNGVRATTMSLYATISPDALQKRGVVDGKPMSVLTMFYLISGHSRHHLSVLTDRYV